MQRYFVSPDQIVNDQVIIVGDDVRHISKVLRYRTGDLIICSTGQGLDVKAEMISIEPDRVICRIVEKIKENRESDFRLILAQALPKADKMDWIIQKGTEIGISAFFPFTSERTIVQLDSKKEAKRIERWEKIAKEAAEQSQRSLIPPILPVMNWKELLNTFENRLAFIAYEQEEAETLFKAINKSLNFNEIILIIGPEGGFSPLEIEEAKKHGAISISLGKRILRTETAGLVGAANIIYHLEEVIQH